MKPGYRKDIDGLRAIAVLLVVGFHAFPRYVAGGFIGVDIFFVISGFLISGLIYQGLQDGDFGFVQFYARRAKRIFPALVVVLAACAIAGWFVLYPVEYRTLGQDIVAGAGFVANLSMLREVDYFQTESELKPLLHLWSLGVEEQFYIVWPVLMASSWRLRNAPLAVACGLFVASFAFNIALARTDALAAFYLPVTRFWELMLGCILAVAGSTEEDLVVAPGGLDRLTRAYRIHRLGICEAAAWLGIALVALATALINRRVAFPGWWALLPTVGAGLIIFAGPTARINRYVLSHPVLVYVGLISYPLYLWHWPILAYLRATQVPMEPTGLMAAAAIAAAFILAAATYRFLERPFRFGIPAASKSIIASVGLAMTASLGALIYGLNGVPSRYPAEMQILLRRPIDLATYRLGTCFLDSKHDFPAFRPECEGRHSANAPIVLLWGDSHAAHLYPGLKEIEQREHWFDLAQYTTGGCPPVFSFHSDVLPYCGAINEAIGQRIALVKPDTVILAGRWDIYDGNHEWGKIADGALEATVAKLKSIGVRRVVAVGQFPVWTMPAPQIRVQNYKARLSAIEPSDAPERNKSFLNPASIAADEKVRQAFLTAGALFISPLSSLCDDDGCLLVIPNADREPLVWDTDHLTKEGSIYFLKSVAPNLLGR